MPPVLMPHILMMPVIVPPLFVPTPLFVSTALFMPTPFVVPFSEKPSRTPTLTGSHAAAEPAEVSG